MSGQGKRAGQGSGCGPDRVFLAQGKTGPGATHNPSRLWRVTPLLDAARYLVDRGRVDEAIRSLTDIVRLTPDREAYELLSHCYIQAREFDEAMVMRDLARICGTGS